MMCHGVGSLARCIVTLYDIRHGIQYHEYAYADDINLHASYNPAVPDDQEETPRRVMFCFIVRQICDLIVGLVVKAPKLAELMLRRY